MADAPGNRNSDESAAKPSPAAGKGRRLDYDLIEPVGWRVVVRKDENRRQTKSGIVLPDTKEIPVITGRIVAVSREVEHDDECHRELCGQLLHQV